MKEHYLSKGAGTTLLGDTDDGYSVYKNPNAELREEIKNFKPDQTKVTMGWPEKTWDIIEWEDKEVKCQSGRNTSYFKIKEVKEALADQEELKRNLKFPAYEYFKHAFGVVSSVGDWGDGKKVSILDLRSHIRLGNYNPTSVEHYNFEYEGKLSTYNELAAELSKGCTSMSIYFNENGDYMNRDYNLNLNNYECKEESLRLILDVLKEKLFAFGEVKYARGSYYSEDKKLTLFIEREDHELRNKFKIGYSILKVKAAPKKMEIRPASAMWEDVLNKIPEDVYDIYRIKKQIEEHA